MIIVIDIGNSTAVLAGIEQDRILFTGEVETNRSYGVAEYTRLLRPILQGRQCQGAILSSVVPQITQAVCQAAGDILGKVPMVVGPETKTGLTVDVPEPNKVGRDRLVDAAWAAEHFPLPAVTADLGTATTLNLVLPGKIFAGGIICAGLQTCLNALHQRTAQLPQLELEIPERIVGKNTAECMLSGAVAGTAAMIDGLVDSIEEELGTPVTLLLTGGGGKYVTQLMRHEHFFDPDMTRKGLALLYQLNQK
ncbi:MAG: type III pantothenate kinase [Candidatus Faecousia sp.]|nr:type III pantothenate kinase [Candidatus Faecousia sp.]